jgi:outer membrane protein OmpA-like peptidoglycan-associated protein
MSEALFCIFFRDFIEAQRVLLRSWVNGLKRQKYTRRIPMKKYLSLIGALIVAVAYVRPVHADSNGNQPETPAGMNQPPVAGSPQTTLTGLPKLEVEFQTGHSDIPPSYSRNLDAFGTYLQQNPQTKAEIIAYADHTGHGPANATLAQNRADSVQKYLVSNYAIAVDRIKAQGYGEVSDKVHNNTEAGKQANRRAIGTIVPAKSQD